MYRTLSLFILIVMCILNPLFALTEGPEQPEYYSFEPVDATNLVNLPTGNLSYVVPLGDVKAPNDVGYPVVLSYHSGITNEQEATWVGLGWSLNVGSINRTVKGYPDDYCGDHYVHNKNSKGDKGLDVYTGPTWEGYGFSAHSSFGFRYSSSTGNVFFMGYTGTDMGTPIGSVHIGNPHRCSNNWSSSWTFKVLDMPGVGSISATYEADKDPEWYSSVNLSYGGMGYSLSSRGDASLSYSGQAGNFSFSVSASAKKTVEQAFSSQSIAINTSFGVNAGWAGTFGGKITPVFWKYTFQQVTQGRSWGYLYQSPRNVYSLETENPILQAFTPDEFSPGYDVPQDGMPNELPHDFEPEGLYVRRVADKLEYIKGDDYNFSSQDIYSLAGQGIGGVFAPQVNNSMTTFYSPDDLINGMVGQPNPNDREEIGTYFNFHNEEAVKISRYFLNNNAIAFKMMGEAGLNLIDNLEGIQYGSGDDLVGHDAYSLVDHANSMVTGTRIEPLIGLDPDFPKKLSGFVITDMQGKTYYYTEPLFSLQKASYMNETKTVPSAIRKANITYSEDFGGHALTWLLTAITGPDYVKRPLSDNPALTINHNEKILPRNGDWGYWTRFRYEYGEEVIERAGMPVPSSEPDGIKTIDKGTYTWRTPYFDSYTAENYHDENRCHINSTNPMKKEKYSSEFGRKEITYLKSIETASEVAFFRTSERMDGFGIDYTSEYPKLSESYPIYPYGEGTGNTIRSNLGRILNGFPLPYKHRRVNQFPSCVPLPEDNNIYSSGQLNTDNMLKIEIDVEGLGLAWWEGMSEGTEFINLDFTARKEFGRIAPYFLPIYWKFSENNNAGKITVVKDTKGWIWDDNLQTIVMDPNFKSGESQETRKDLALGSTLSSSRTGVNIEIPLLPIEGLDIPFPSKFTPYAQCVHARMDDHNEKLILYIMGYQGRVEGKVWDKKLVTGCTFGSRYFVSKHSTLYDLRGIYDIKFNAGYISDQVWKRHEHRNPAVRYVKKLDEIAWYSKSRYPMLDGSSDPRMNPDELEYLVDQYDYPQSYRRVKFRYNYELAKGTPNSKSDGLTFGTDGMIAKDGYKGGRLTLKEIREEAGPESNPVSLPPYLFDYQGKDKRYAFGFDYEDEWGFPKNIDENQETDQTGVYWNLESVLLPSCSKLSFEYKRDYLNSIYGTMVKMRREQFCVNDYMNSYYLEPNTGDYYEPYTIVSYTEGSTQMTVTGSGPIAPGSFALIRINDRDGNQIRTNYTYRVESVTGNTITLNQPVTIEPAEVGLDDFTLLVLKPSLVYGGGVRVSKIQTSSLAGTFESTYEYPQGAVLKTLPPKAQPTLFVKDLYKFEAENIDKDACPDCMKDAYFDDAISGYDGNGYIRQPDDDGEYHVYFENFPVEHAGAYLVLIRYNAQHGNAMRRVKFNTFGGGNKTFSATGANEWDTLYLSYSIPDWWHNEHGEEHFRISIESTNGDELNTLNIDWVAVKKKSQGNIVDSKPFELGIYHEHIYGGPGMNYPVVEVQQTVDGVLTNGLIRYNFYTIEDSVEVNSVKIPLLAQIEGETSTGVPIAQIIDHTGLINKEKIVEQLDVNRNVISWKKPVYAFSEELNDNQGVLLSSLSDRLPSTRPIGLTRTRMKRMESKKVAKDDFYLSSISDYITSTPYVVGIEEHVDGVTKKSYNGLFDAWRGSALVSATENHNADGEIENVVVANIPATSIKTGNDLEELKDKNIYSQSYATITAESNIAGLPSTIQSVIDEHALVDGDYTILGASVDGWTKYNNPAFGGSITFDQYCFYKDTAYKWAGSPTFDYPTPVSPEWIKESRVKTIDRYGRALTLIDAEDKPFTLKYHPVMGRVVGKIDLASHDEAAVLTCDFDDLERDPNETAEENGEVKDDGYYDFIEGWEKQQSVLSTQRTHFGNKSVHVSIVDGQNGGPAKGLDGVDKTKSYLFSAWVNPVTVNAANPICLAVEIWNEGGYVETVDQASETFTDLTVDLWQHVERSISSADLANLDAGEYIRIAVCSRVGAAAAAADFYVDDIRFYPDDAMITTYYYDQNLKLPITFVDVNHNARTYQYDVFGRLIAKGTLAANY